MVTREDPERQALAEYRDSMPAAYRNAFSEEEILSHGEIVGRRGDRATHIEIWREMPEEVVAICVVANDKPGLLSCISAALVVTRIDVVAADAYCRKRDNGPVEAVDFLWIRRLPGASGVVPPIRARDIVAVAGAIEQAAGDGTAPSSPMSSGRIASASGQADAPVPAPSARIRFETDPKDGSTLLTVEAVDRPGLLLAVTQALFRAGLQIIGLRATTERGAAVDRFHIAEVDGAALKTERLLTLQAAILEAIDEGTLAPPRRSTA